MASSPGDRPNVPAGTGRAVDVRSLHPVPCPPWHRYAAVRSCSPDSLPDGNSGTTEAEAVEPALRRVPAAGRHPAVGAVVVPAAAPVQPVLALRIVQGVRGLRSGQVLAPLPDIAVHVA